MSMAAGVWQAHTSAEGRTYYHNTATGATQWEKPEDLMTPAELALANQPWKEYTADGGRKYWYNTETQQSSWEMPDIYKQALGVSDTPSHSTSARPGFQNNHSHDSRDHRDRDRDYRDRRDRERDRDHRDRDCSDRNHHNNNRLPDIPALFQPTIPDPEFANVEEAEAAFVKLLKRSGVQCDWSYEQAVRAVAHDPMFRAIHDPRDRKAAFEKYCQDSLEQGREKAKERIAKLRSGFQTMLKSHDEIKHYTRWKTARSMVEGETIFRSTNNEEERRLLFIEYAIGLKKAYVEHQVSQSKAAMDGLISLLGSLNLEPYTRWHEAQSKIISSPVFQQDEKYQSLSQFDILTAFQNHVKALERAFNDSKQQQKIKKYRTERKNHDAFKALLSELKKDGKLNAATKWMQIYPLIEKDERYIAMAGQSGSTAQELFWDVLEDEEKGLRDLRNTILDILDDKHFEVTSKTTFAAFQEVIKDNSRVADTDDDILALLFERLQERKVKRHDDDRYPERLQRKAAENFKAYLKHLDPPLTPSDTYEKVKPRISRSDEYQFLYSDETRRSIFDKVQRRNRDREEEDRDRLQKRRGDRASGDRDLYRERDRSRGERSHRSGGGRRRSRSPTVSGNPDSDPYEADRRKAIAERERNNSRRNAESLLDTASVSGRERDRDSRPRSRERERLRSRDRERERDKDRSDREHLRSRDREHDHDYDRHHSRRDDDYYERDRHPRDDDRLYRRRGDRSGSYDELNYDDERPISRRRRHDEEDDKRDSKRQRTVRDRTPHENTPLCDSRPSKRSSPPVPSSDCNGQRQKSSASDQDKQAASANKSSESAPQRKSQDEDVAMNSGSEEGEIEE